MSGCCCCCCVFASCKPECMGHVWALGMIVGVCMHIIAVFFANGRYQLNRRIQRVHNDSSQQTQPTSSLWLLKEHNVTCTRGPTCIVSVYCRLAKCLHVHPLRRGWPFLLLAQTQPQATTGCLLANACAQANDNNWLLFPSDPCALPTRRCRY